MNLRKRTFGSGRAKGLRFSAEIAVAAMAALALALLIWRNDVVRLMPQTAAFFQLAGLGVNLRGLAIEDVRVSTEMVDGNRVFIIEGAIAATSAAPQTRSSPTGSADNARARYSASRIAAVLRAQPASSMPVPLPTTATGSELVRAAIKVVAGVVFPIPISPASMSIRTPSPCPARPSRMPSTPCPRARRILP